MKKKSFHKDISGYSKQVLLCCKRVIINYDEETNHKLRVNFKKLRALLRWQYAESKELIKPFRKMFHAAGDIRTAALLYEFITAQKIHMPVCRQWVKKRHRTCRQHFKNVYDENRIKERTDKIKEMDLPYQRNDSFLLDNIQEIKEILTARPLPDTAIHEIRKKIKDIQYVAEGCLKKKISLTVLKNHTVEQLKETTDRIGKYNDLVSVSALLATYLKEHKNSIETQKAALVHKRWLQQKRKEKIHLIQHIKNNFT